MNLVRKSIGLVGFKFNSSSFEINRKDLLISFLSTRATSAISFNVRGTLNILHAAYKLAAATPSMLLPRIR